MRSWLARVGLGRDLRREFRDDGVEHVEYVVDAVPPYRFWAWLGTATDAQRDRLAADPALQVRVSRLADQRGAAPLLRGVTVKSGETVDRDYAGRWFYRLK